ncbi:MAG: hypothetical protein C4520_09830 [Candidatus Abyssobacteria bacterium SURF_5]|uniref:Uncharacterized protein n=1 Tax=Abyssobacteria bacterium (strain SURF_5) TaxID=2093360 RepID=A0A3A4NZY1_ABYX5|nr:MAG: hypothetical protein C4520_09830 [Candidatus Abyssubacteria bacterium SURF_5]
MGIRRKVFALACGIVIILLLGCRVFAADEGDAVKALQEAIARVETDKEKGVLRKELGDLYVQRDELQQAAAEYLKALELNKNFSDEERLQMAVYISWADRYDDAIAVLQPMLRRNPGFIEARVHLARTLSWAGSYDEAIHEADRVLQLAPGNRDALLVKANALNWKGKPAEAIPLYEVLLAEEENFDARLGMAHAYLALGERETAIQNKDMLEPTFPYQERELHRLDQALSAQFRPSAKAQYSHYDDSDGNLVDTYSAGATFWVYGLNADLQYRHTEARNHSLENSADEAALTVYANPTAHVGVGAGVGVAQSDAGDSDTFFTWSARADVDVLKGKAGVVVTRDFFAEVADLIENDIRVTRTNVYLFQNLTDRLFAHVGYTYSDFSDDNDSDEVLLVTRYLIYPKNPAINIGYRVRYLNFNRQSGGGYFDPNDFISNQIFASAYYERQKLYLYVEPFFGHESFRRSGDNADELVGGGYGSIGYRITNNCAVELFGEGGNFSVDSAAGFDYYLVGANINVKF